MARQQIRATLPSPPESIDNPEDLDLLLTFLYDTIKIIEENFRTLERAEATGWQPANVPATGNRDIDADTATLDQTRKSLTRLIQDLKDSGALAA